MKVTSGKAIAIFLVLCSCSNTLHAQVNLPKHELGLSVGTFVYQGDLTPEAAGAFKSPGFAFNVFYNRILTRSFSFRANLAHGRLRADDANYDDPAWRRERSLRFTARNTEIAALMVWNIFGNNYGDRKTVSPYLFGGVGLSSLRINRDWSRVNYDYFAADSTFLNGLAADTLHVVPGTIPVIPVGLGIRYPISKKLSVMAEASYRITFSDYIDGFSKSSNPDKNDAYSNYSIGIIYTFGRNNSLDCPPMRY
ncbi:DUF6089 family protein [Longitalea luteola]|uniref:DUF6089 family protein n=1 Tax=Longitalea luteola TaxID=2812563 RepID=UPI001A963C26|nr:DUF6089 family protein [Longitalea luteola]